MTGPLAGVTVIEMAAIGPVPFAGMVLADLGAEVIRLDRTEPSGLGIGTVPRFDVPGRGKKSVALDLKSAEGIAAARRLIASAEIVLEGFRPGVMERLGLGPEICLADNPRLVYGRISGWGSTGPMAAMAGHDLNYLGLSGALNAMGPADAPPSPPLNLVGDYGGGAMMLALGAVAATLHARATGQGQVVETSIAGGALALTPMLWGLIAGGRWGVERHDNLLDGGAPFYRCYECQDGRHVAVGALEPKFFQILIEGMGLSAAVKPQRQYDKTFWPELGRIFTETFKSATRDEWARRFDGKDACLTPVLDWTEAPNHLQHKALGSFAEIGGVTQPAAHPLFSKTPSGISGPAPAAGADNAAILARLGYGEAEIAALTGSSA